MRTVTDLVNIDLYDNTRFEVVRHTTTTEGPNGSHKCPACDTRARFKAMLASVRPYDRVSDLHGDLIFLKYSPKQAQIYAKSPEGDDFSKIYLPFFLKKMASF